ncbi:MAG: hypothetical protein DRQ51_10825 [Gammaproteobacteria bacterium]|nr:MAG: hypothetical protein DRQ51_10825 [Gammaproteobacteria bacterium]
MNVDDMNLNISIKYTINSISYMSASASALIMVQDGVHSFADQLVSVSIGNFIGLFFYEFFLYDTEHIQSVKFYTHKDLFYITTSWKF